jgi:hypothetical protein
MKKVQKMMWGILRKNCTWKIFWRKIKDINFVVKIAVFETKIAENKFLK